MPHPAAGQVRAAIVAIELAGEVPEELSGEVAQAVESGLRPVASHVVLPDADSAASESCREGPCMTALGERLSAHALVRARLDQEGQLYVFDIELFLARDGSRIGSVSQECAACTWTEALALVTRAAEGLTSSLPGLVTVHLSAEAAATVTSDGEPIASGEPVALRPGTHRVAAVTEGGSRAEQQITVVAGAASELTLTLSGPGPAPPPPPGERAQPSRALAVWGWVTAGLAGAALVPGILWLALDGQCELGGNVIGGICEDVYYTWPQGLAFTVTGGALLITSIILFAVHARSRREARRGLVFGLAAEGHGGGLHLAGWF
jgi:hypothetical protein